LSRHPRGFALLELIVSIGFFGLFSVVMFYSLNSTAQVWRKTSGRDTALRQILRARTSIARDLKNASTRPNQFQTSKVGPSLAAGYDGDAFTFLSCENESTPWSINSSGQSVLTRQVTYSLFVPQNVNGKYGGTFPGVADTLGYEQGCPYKWLVRRWDAAPTLVAPNPEPAIASNWTTNLLFRPTSMAAGSNYQIVATLLGLRVISAGSHWQIELKACAVQDAQRNIGIGATPLGNSPYTLVQRFSVTAHN
jgi:type II secretory pathway pseudopilin PulG